MTEDQINFILEQIESGKAYRKQDYMCCDECFTSLYDFRKHLYDVHPDEMNNIFAASFHRETSEKPTKEEIHRLANKGKKKIERKRIRKELKKRAENRAKQPSPNTGDHFHLIYTPMGNKR